MKLIEQITLELEKVEETNVPINPMEAYSFLKMWAPVLILVMTLVKIFTGSKADRKIDQFINYLQIIK